jgi:hypothetical protein
MMVGLSVSTNGRVLANGEGKGRKKCAVRRRQCAGKGQKTGGGRQGDRRQEKGDRRQETGRQEAGKDGVRF